MPDELIGRITAEVGLPPDVAATAVRIVLNFLHAEGPSATVERIAGELGAGEMLGAPAAGKGLLGAIGGLFGGGGAMAAFSALTSAGLDIDQIQRLTRTFVTYAEEKVGPEPIGEVLDAIPALRQFL